jgi:hypothetical protein
MWLPGESGQRASPQDVHCGGCDVLKVATVLDLGLVNEDKVRWALFGIEVFRVVGDDVDKGVPDDGRVVDGLRFLDCSFGHVGMVSFKAVRAWRECPP